jgi:hypothetical protein
LRFHCQQQSRAKRREHGIAQRRDDPEGNTHSQSKQQQQGRAAPSVYALIDPPTKARCLAQSR